MRTKAWLLIFAAAVSLILPVRGEEAPPPPKEDEPKSEAPAKPPEGRSDRKLAELAARYDVPEKDVRDLRDKDMGWGEIGHALAISKKAGVPLADVVKLREDGMGWGKIAQNYGFKLGEVAGKARDIERDGRKAEREDRGVGRRDKDEGRSKGAGHRPGEPGHHGRGMGPRK